MATPSRTKGTIALPYNKSSAIREYLAAHPKAGPTAVRDALRSAGVTVSTAHVSNIKAKLAPPKAKPSTKSKPAKPLAKPKGTRGETAEAEDRVSLSQLVEARKFAAQVGGVAQALLLLQTLAKLQ
jgi:hypothetical protein